MPETPQDLAQKLKDEGNTLFAQRKYIEALDKYTAAIDIHDKNAVLWTNRAACKLNLNRHLDAADDASKAIELDPSYGKAWWRLGQAHQETGKLQDSAKAYERAIQCVCTAGASDSDRKQRAVYQAALGVVTKRQSELEARIRTREHVHELRQDETRGKMPWERATAMLPQLGALGGEHLKSSAFVIHEAYGLFRDFINGMDKVQVIPCPEGEMLAGPLGILDLFASAIIADERVFHVTDSKFIDKLNRQAKLESTQRRSWTSEGPEVVIAEAQQRLAKEGWDSVRSALGLTIRGWITKGFLASTMQREYGPAVTMYQNAIDFLERGHRIWRNVPNKERGTMFEGSFVRGVKGLLIKAFMSAHVKDPKGAIKYPLQKLIDMADELLEDVKKAPIPRLSFESDGCPPGHISAFWSYAAEQAHSIKGACYNRMARSIAPNEQSGDKSKSLFAQAAKSYLTASEMYHMDDENHALNISCALAAYAKAGTSIAGCLPLMAKLRASVPEMRSIWEYSNQALYGTHRRYDTTSAYEDELRAEIQAGRLSEKDLYCPPFDM